MSTRPRLKHVSERSVSRLSLLGRQARALEAPHARAPVARALEAFGPTLWDQLEQDSRPNSPIPGNTDYLLNELAKRLRAPPNHVLDRLERVAHEPRKKDTQESDGFVEDCESSASYSETFTAEPVSLGKRNEPDQSRPAVSSGKQAKLDNANNFVEEKAKGSGSGCKK